MTKRELYDDLAGSFDLEPHIFLDGGVTQFRTHLKVGAPVQ